MIQQRVNDINAANMLLTMSWRCFPKLNVFRPKNNDHCVPGSPVMFWMVVLQTLLSLFQQQCLCWRTRTKGGEVTNGENAGELIDAANWP